MGRAPTFASLAPRLLVVAAVLIALVAPAAAQPAERTEVIAVLPMSASSDRLALYAKPVADALARRIRAIDGVRAESLSLDADVPTRVVLVVDGRIVAGAGDQISLEARVRDPRSGISSGSVASGEGALSEIDALADELARKLASALRDALADKRRREQASRARRAASGATTGAASSMVVMASAAPVPGVAVPVEEATARAAERLVQRLGFRPQRSDYRADMPQSVLVDEIRRAGARYGLMLRVYRVSFYWHGAVLSARGRVRAVLVDAEGRILFDRRYASDTVVGGRGDGHVALLNHLEKQLTEIVWARLRRAVDGP